jgi:hypothetical protein
MKPTSRFLIVALIVAAILYMVSDALGLSAQALITLDLVGALFVAGLVEWIIMKCSSAKP